MKKKFLLAFVFMINIVTYAQISTFDPSESSHDVSWFTLKQGTPKHITVVNLLGEEVFKGLHTNCDIQTFQDGLYIVQTENVKLKVVIQQGIIVGVYSLVHYAHIEPLQGDYYVARLIKKSSGDTLLPTNQKSYFTGIDSTQYLIDQNVRMEFSGSTARIYSLYLTQNPYPTAGLFSFILKNGGSQIKITQVTAAMPAWQQTVQDLFLGDAFVVRSQITCGDISVDGYIIENDSVRVELARYIPIVIQKCAPEKVQERPENVLEFIDKVNAYGPMHTFHDTVSHVMRAVHTTMMRIMMFNGSNCEIPSIGSITLDSALYLTKHDKGGVCGNYAQLFARILHEVYGIPAWGFSMGYKNLNDARGHVQTLVMKVVGGDSLFYVYDSDFNYYYMDSVGHPLDLQKQVYLVAQQRNSEIFISQNTELGIVPSLTPCLNPILDFGCYTPNAYVEDPIFGDSLYRQHLVRRVENFLATSITEYQNISQEYTSDFQGKAQFVSVTDFVKSPLWFRSLYTGPQTSYFENKLKSLMSSQF